MNANLDKLFAHLKGMGVTVELTSDDRRLNCPFDWNTGLNYKRKILYFSGTSDKETIGSVIHEAGHILASKKSPNARTVKEYDHLGWEFALALELDLLTEALPGYMYYGLLDNDGGGLELRDLDDGALSELVEERIDYARSIGLVVGDRAVAIR